MSWGDSVAHPDRRPKLETRTNNKPTDNGNGKGKAKQCASDDDDEDDDEAYVTSNDYGSPYRYSSANGSTKGKEVVRDGLLNDGYRETTPGDDGDLYN